MTDELALAFSRLEARAGATAPSTPDRISLRDYVVEVEIGAFQPERGKQQRLRFNVVVEVKPEGEIADDVDRILSYDRITEAISAELAGDRLNLLETLADHLAARILHEPQALRVFIRIEKLDLGPGALGVEIVRSPSDYLEVASVEEHPATPVVILLSQDAVSSPNLGRWLDAIEGAGMPAVLAIGETHAEAPKASHLAAQRRIDLLALEQAAWVLAARDPRCVVVESRTELDWAVGKRRISVWAPSKMVLDAPEPPQTAEPARIAAWLGQELGARRLISVGIDPGEGWEMRLADAEHIL